MLLDKDKSPRKGEKNNSTYQACYQVLNEKHFQIELYARGKNSLFSIWRGT